LTLESSDAAAARPLLRVVRGDATAEELAALIAVLTARGSAEPDPEPVRSLWARPSLRQPLTPGPGAWRASALPR
jgi:hypothetical protein